MPSLNDIYQELHRQATRTRQDRAANLIGGARLVVRETNVSSVVTFSRPEKRLSDTELVLFENACKIPTGARRVPETGQKPRERDGVTFYTVSYVWNKE